MDDKQIMQSQNILLNVKVASKEELFQLIANKAFKAKLVKNKADLISAFNDREKIESTAFEEGFAIPHVCSDVLTDVGVFFCRLKEPIKWDESDKIIDCVIVLLTPNKPGEYLDILSNIAVKLMKPSNRQALRVSLNTEEIINILTTKVEQKQTVEVKSKTAFKIVGVCACLTGTIQCYMARDAILEEGKKLKWNVSVEVRSLKGVEFALSPEDIDEADAVILAIDSPIELDRFVGKKVYRIGTKNVISEPVLELNNSVTKGRILSIDDTDDSRQTIIGNIKGHNEQIGSVKAAHIQFLMQTSVFYKKEHANFLNKIRDIKAEYIKQISTAKINNESTELIKDNYKTIYNEVIQQFRALNKAFKVRLKTERQVYRDSLVVENELLEKNKEKFRDFTISKKNILKQKILKIREQIKNVKIKASNKQEAEQMKRELFAEISLMIDNYHLSLQKQQAIYREPALERYRRNVEHLSIKE